MNIVFTVIITFVITALWQWIASKKVNETLNNAFLGLINDMNEMAIQLGYKDVIDYYQKVKGETYAQNAQMNIENTFKVLQ
jgi:hypothetical protein